MVSLRRIEDDQLKLETWNELHSNAGRLTSLVIHGCHLNTFGGNHVPNFPSLTDLNLSSNYLTDLSGSGFLSLHALTRLDLSSNRLRGECFLQTISRVKFPSLQHLSIPYNAISSLAGIPGDRERETCCFKCVLCFH
jgi:Leucine-rich repeat (LRR) protein